MASNDYPVAVIGIACRVPHCDNPSEFWQFIRNKKDAVGKFPSSRAKDIDHILQSIDPSKLMNPEKPYFTGSWLESIDKFDAQFFGISPNEAASIDPQQRFFMRTAWEAFEDAGIASKLSGSEIGVYVGDTCNKYEQLITERTPSSVFGNHPVFIAPRPSCAFDLRGPAVLVGTGCSSSLMAIHLACQALKNGDCKAAIAGGVTIESLPINVKSDLWNLLKITADDIQCTPFNENPRGTVKGEGCAAVVLKPLNDAIKDGNHIYGVVVGTSTNQNGQGNGLSLPQPKANCEVMIDAWRKAEISTEDIDYFEAHGTGTKIGDPIEILGIQMAFESSNVKGTSKSKRRDKPCLGSVKANIGHLADGVAGVIGLIKVLLSLENEAIPPQIHYENPNKMIDWKRCPFKINTELVDWKRSDNKPRVAAVSSFGLVGTNVHLVVREYQPNKQKVIDNEPDSGRLILLSAATQRSLKNFIEKLRTYLKSVKYSKDSTFFKNVVYTLNNREHHKFAVKSLIFAETIDELKEKLRSILHHLDSKQVRTITDVDEKDFKDALRNDGYICFSVDKKKKMKSKSSQLHQSLLSKSVDLFRSIVSREPILWHKDEAKNRSIVPLLPTYSFDEERYWPVIPNKRIPESDSAVASITSTEDDYSLSDEKTGVPKTSTLTDNYRKTLKSLSKHIETTRNLSENDLHFFSTLGDLLQVVQKKLKHSLEDNVLNDKLAIDSSRSSKTGELFLNFEIEDENLRSIEKLLNNQVRLVNYSPHTVVQSILDSKNRQNVDFQVLVFTNEMSKSLLEQLSQVLMQTDKTLEKVPLVILELRLSSHGDLNFAKALRLKYRRIYSQTFEIQSKYQLSFAKNEYDVPFNFLGYQYVSSLISRSIRSVIYPSKLKVIAVDADHTLWKGECSNEKVVVEEHHLLLQEFLIKKYESGFLLVLLSKNTESDVQNVFKNQKNDLLITLDHFVIKKVNWNSKHQNLSDVCKELNLSTDSVTFIDDNILECVSMVTQHPSVLCLCFPSTLNATRGLLDNIWALDSFETTNDGRRRSEYYRQESERRETLKEQSLTEVLRSWNMVLKIFTSKASFLKSQFTDAFNRSQELVNRTNQFKMNTQVMDLMKYSDCKCLVLSLEDKFGSYGTVSVVLFKIEHKALIVEQWVLSCRALGRNVEHNILRHLQTISKKFDCETIRIKFNRTEKNDPAFNFLKDADFTEVGYSNGFKWMSSSFTLSDFVPIQMVHVKAPESSGTNEEDENESQYFMQHSQSVDPDDTDFKKNIDACKDWIRKWPKELKSQERIDCLNPALIEHLSEYQNRNENHEESVLSASWHEILGVKPTDKSHFFHSGGTSFKAVYFISKLREKLQVNIRLSHVYQNPTFGEIQRLLKSLESTKKHSPPALNSKSKSDEFKLSAIQNTFVMLQEVAPNSTAYTENIAVSGFFDDFKPEHLLKKLLKHFPLLKSAVDENGNCDKIMSLLTEEEVIRSSILETVTVASKQSAVRRARDSRPHFTLKMGESLFRLLTIKISNDSESNKMVVLYIHHILIDDVSLSDLEHCLFQLLLNKDYQRRKELKSYNEFSESEYQYLNSEQMQDDLKTISKSFETIPANCSLGFSAEIWSDTKTYDCESKRIEVTLNVEEVCRNLNIRPFHYFLSCYLLTLKRYTAENDLLIGLPLTTRSHEFENSFGPFLNMVLFRYTIDAENNLQSFMKSVALRWFETQDINRLPLEKVMSYLRENEKIGGTSLSSIFNYSALPKCESSVHIPPLHAKAPFYVNVRDGDNKVSFTFEWATAFIENQVANNFCNSFVNICEKITDNFNEMRSEPVISIDVMCESEYKTIMNFNRKLTSSKVELAHRFFENHCKNNGNKVAVYCGEKSFTYNQINSMANKIAAYLQQTVNENDLQKKPIVIMMERTEMVIASIFAVWKVGGYFLTISEDIQERLLQLEQTRKVTVDLILTNLTADKITVKIPRHIKVKNVNEVIRDKSSAVFEDRLHFSDPKSTIAYMFLTSGTTGEPKRCLINHQALNVFVNGFLNEYETDKFEMSLLQFVSICFDVFIQDLAFSLLCVGGSMTLVSPKDRLDVEKVAKIMVDHKISCCSITPRFGISLFTNLPQRSLKHLRMLILCGEEFYQNMHEKFASKLEPTTRIINMWGVTETTLVSTFFSGPLNYLTSSAQVPIGRAMAGINIFILDPNSKLLCPVGTNGEICLTGVVVGKGDVKSTKLSITGEDPVHFTGDVGRWLPDGNIDFVGRKASTFFKIRGFRVNPREVELVVSKNIGRKLEYIRVFATEDRFEQRILCLVYIPKNEVKDDSLGNEIRTIIKSRLPYYMVPSVVKCINEIPLTSHGKTDEKALRRLCLGDEINEKAASKIETNLSSTESMLLKYLKASVAHSQPIDVNLNFRDQGIHSLALMKFANLMLNDKVPGFKGVVDLFDYPNIKQLAQNISAYNVTIEPQFISSPKGDDCKMAIVGMSFRLPKNIKTFSEFVKALKEKQCLVDDFPSSRANDYLTRLQSDELEKVLNKQSFKGAFLDEIDKFDHEYFGISPLEAKHMCPEQRLWMEVATEAITDSGHIRNIRGSNFGVFMAFTDIHYEDINSSSEAVGVVGKLASFIPARTAYHFDLKGPTAVINSACSSGVVVLHQACEAIKAGTCDGAIIGGLHFILYPTKDGWMDEKMCIQSSDSCCRPFDENSNGIVPGEGVIALVIEPLQKAIDNNRFIYGVIESTSVNSVGRGNGITAPSVSSQIDLISSAINSSSLSRSDIKVIEAHGSGTKLGDTIELTALQEVFKDNPEPVYVCGSKSNFGHLNEASGFLGILKVLTTLMTHEIAAAANFDRPNSVLKESNLLIPTRNVKLNNDFAAGVSAFGLSGTNGHVILSRRDVKQRNNDLSSEKHPLLLWCQSIDDLQNQVEKYYNYIKLMVVEKELTSLGDICATVCRKLKNTAKKRSKSENIRLVLLLKDEEQSLSLLQKLKSVDRSQLKKLSERDSNVIDSANGVNNFIDTFITNGDIEEDFVNSFAEYQNAPCLPMFLFQSVRHWPEECVQERVEKVTNINVHRNQSICIKTLLDEQLEKVHDLVSEVDLETTTAAQEMIDRFSSACIGKLFRDCSLEKYWKVGKTYDTYELFKKSKIIEDYFCLFRSLCRHLAKCGFIRSNKIIHDDLPTNFTILVDMNDKRLREDPAAIAKEAIPLYPCHQDCFKIVLHNQKTFLDVMLGKASALSVLFNGGDFEFNNRHYRIGDPLGSIYMKHGIATAAKYVKKLARQTDRKIRILELGGGFGLLTKELVPKLAKIGNIEYWFTDIGRTFVNKAEQVYSKYSDMMKFAIFDITRPCEEQGIPGGFDLIVAYNVVHVTDTLLPTIRNLSATLNDTGTMFIFETTHGTIWMALSWGIFINWWTVKDFEYRSEALCKAESWERVFNQKELNFNSVYSWPTKENERKFVSRFVFVCCKQDIVQLGSPKRPQLVSEINLKTNKQQEYKEMSTKKEKRQKKDEKPSSNKKSYQEIVTALRKIWTTILGVEEIEESDRFGELGGESLLTIEMMHNVRNEIGVELQLAHCYAYPSLHELASFIQTLSDESNEPGDDSNDSDEEMSSNHISDIEEIDYNEEIERPLSPEPNLSSSLESLNETHPLTSNIKPLLDKYMLEIKEMVAEVDFKPKGDEQETIDRYAVACITKLLRDCSLEKYWKVGKSYNTEEIFKKTKIKDNYFSLFRFLLRHLSKHGIIRSNKVIYDNLPVNFTVLIDLNDKRTNEDPNSIADYGIKTFPSYQDCFKIAQHNMKTFKDVLTGKESPLSVLFKKGDFDFNKRHDKVGDPLGSIYMKKGVSAIAEHVKRLSEDNDRTIRILEIGAGFGQLTEQLVPKLPDADNVEFWFTDVGKTFLNKAEKVYSKYSKIMRYAIFDITKPAEAQGLPSEFDVIVAYNVVHVTESLQQTCQNLYSTLNNTGVMFIFETVRPNMWITFGWGIFDGWWLFKDYDLRTEALCTEENWKKVFKKCDFKSVYTWPEDQDEKEYVSRFMFVCCKEGTSERVDHFKSKSETNFMTLEKPKSITQKTKPKLEKVKKQQTKKETSSSKNKKSYEEIVNSLKKIWKTILGVDEVEENDRFGELGGESLLTIEMMHNVRNEIGVELQLAHCYAYPSLQELAGFIQTLFDDCDEAGDNSNEEDSSNSFSAFEELGCNDEMDKSSDCESTEDTLLMFCGQGAQKETMFNSLLNDPDAMEVFEEAKEIIGVDILKEFENKECLKRTSFLQVALFVGCMAKIKQIEKESPHLLKNIKAVAGLSVGEIAGLAFAKVLSFEDALRLVHLRGNAMQDVVDTTPSAMTSILGPNRKELTSFLEDYFPNLCISGYLADNQHTVSGDESTIDEFLSKLSEESVVKELKLMDVRKLRVPGAFHTDFMQAAAFEIESVIESMTFRRPKYPIILNLNGKVSTDPKVIKEAVKQQCCSALEWKQTIVTAVEMGIRNFIEVSPSPILTAIIRRRIQECIDTNSTATCLQI